MKKILYIALCILAMAASQSCTKEEEQTVEYLSVSNYNIAGSWELVEWNGSPLGEGSYAYINLDRSDKTFTSYTNLYSFSPVVKTGRYDLYDGDIIYGIYDYSFGTWEHYYIVSELTADRMVWTAEDDSDEVRVYARVDSIPVASDEEE